MARRIGGAIRRPFGARALWGLGAVGGIAAAVLGAPVEVLGQLASVGLMATLMLAGAWRSRALRRIEALPFPVRHNRASAVSGWSQNYSAIREVRIDLVQALDPIVAEQVAGEAQARVAGLSVATHGDALVISGWPWRTKDLLLLSTLLSTWGSELHAAHPIREVFVTWAPGGPTAIA